MLPLLKPFTLLNNTSNPQTWLDISCAFILPAIAGWDSIVSVVSKLQVVQLRNGG
jgi:hypothetical protein